MQADFTLPSQSNFVFTDVLPEAYKGYVLSGGVVLTAVDPQFGTIVQQEFSNSHYTIRHNFFDVRKPYTLQGFQQGARLTSFLSMRSTIDYTIRGIGKFKLKPGQFTMLHTPRLPAAAVFHKAKAYECIEVSWKDDWLQSLQQHFEFLKSLFVPMTRQKKGFFLPPRPRLAGVHALDKASSILSLPYTADISRLFYKGQAYEYMLLLLIESSKKELPAFRLTENETAIITAIGKRIQQDVSVTYRKADLAREAGMNIKKFNRAFREVWGQPFSRVSISARMHEARRLLLETNLTTKQIHEMIAYDTAASFIKYFKKYFGYNVSEVPRPLG